MSDLVESMKAAKAMLERAELDEGPRLLWDPVAGCLISVAYDSNPLREWLHWNERQGGRR